jgi:2'-5' RNA ligase
MIGDRPLSLMIKPPARQTRAIAERRRQLDIDERYGYDRFHLTFLPLGDTRDVPEAAIELLHQAICAADLEPFPIELARLSGNVMQVGKGAANMCRVQQRLVRQLLALGMDLPDYRLRPHLSLTYGERSNRSARFPPIAWHADRLLLIRSIHGEGRHEPVREWRLTPRQGVFDF